MEQKVPSPLAESTTPGYFFSRSLRPVSKTSPDLATFSRRLSCFIVFNTASSSKSLPENKQHEESCKFDALGAVASPQILRISLEHLRVHSPLLTWVQNPVAVEELGTVIDKRKIPSHPICVWFGKNIVLI